jgi:hypothetical protein
MLDIDKAWKVSQKAALLGREVLLDYFGTLSKVSEKNQAWSARPIKKANGS